MTQEVREACQAIVAMVKAKRKELANRPATFEEIYNLSQEVVGFMAYLIPHRVDAEAAFNLELATLVADNPIGKAQILGKATEAYRSMRYIEYMYDWADQEQMLLKKLLSSKEKEFYL